MGKLFVRTALSHFVEAEALENCHHLTRFEDRRLGHRSVDLDGLNANKLTFELGLTVFKQHRYDLAKVDIELVERFGLAVCAGESGYMPDVQASLGVAFNHCRVALHKGPRVNMKTIAKNRLLLQRSRMWLAVAAAHKRFYLPELCPRC
jgi:hypothetical protein